MTGLALPPEEQSFAFDYYSYFAPPLPHARGAATPCQMGEGKQSLSCFGFALTAGDSRHVEQGCLGSQVSVAGTGIVSR